MKRIPLLAACMTLGVVLIVSALIAQQNPSPVPSSLAPEQASDPAKKKVSSARPAPAQQNTPADLGGAPLRVLGGYGGGSGSGMGMGSGSMGAGMGMSGMMGSGYPGGPEMMGFGSGPMFDPETAQAFAQAVHTLQSDAADEAAKEAARKLIADQLRLQFDMDQANRRRQMEDLERRIAQLREQLEKREEAKERLVELRIMLLENESAGLGFPQQWNQLPGMSGQSGMPGMLPGGMGMSSGMGGMMGMGAMMGTGGMGGMDTGSGMSRPIPMDPGPAPVAVPAATANDPTAKNLQQIALAMHNFHDALRAFPAAYSVDREGKPLLSWRVHILPFLGHADLYNQFHLDEPWDSAHNQKLISKIPDVYRSPDIPMAEGNTLYFGNAGKQGVFEAPRSAQQDTESPLGINLASITDGTSNTIMVVEVNKKWARLWTRPEDFVYQDHEDPWQVLVGDSGDEFQAAMCDGRPMTFRKSAVELPVLTALFTRDGGEPIPWQRIK